MQALKDASHLYEVERRQYHAEHPGFRINELQVSKTQDVTLQPGETYTVAPRRPDLVTNAGAASATFLVLQGIVDYDFVPLLAERRA
jgi:hypothetical protein